ncbi:uncharacterized protein PpBr36_10468 [Pyricularia pennisetigena]|uniref:uncharacterized protein n=1 Tax=Pyricularia pennisetigena TaxID=1578925 RepID=UPI0011512C4F|nr:uncharacterized protein PpBr36_10468 [Pyricularia pennisetigena]TLS21069.1 hypothetical protein PpBr36_10468 [Pyricularia pennisetigena]
MQFSTISAFSLAAAGVQAAKGFTSTCRMVAGTYSQVGFTITTECQRADGEFDGSTTSLDITNCFHAIDGIIACGPGGISGCSCGNNPNGVGIMTCTCPKNSGALSPQQQVDLNQCIGNDNGKLVC